MKRRLLLLSVAALIQSATLQAQTQAPAHTTAPAASASVPSPVTFFKQPIGSDYYLANYTEYEAYVKALAAASDRVKLGDIGRSAEGRTQWVAIASSPANLARLEEYRAVAEKLARGRVSAAEAEARQLSESGKAIVWIDAGMHATETVTS